MQKNWALFMVLAFSATIFAQTASAQTGQPQFLLTWSTSNSYAPANYSGKTLPNIWSTITASVELIENGKPLNLSGQTIYWYLDDNLLGGGIGAQRVTFQPYNTAPNSLELKVELPGYPGTAGIHEISIPVVQPEAVVEAPYPSGNFSANQLNIQALPYFFATTSTTPLSFTWNVNGQPVSAAENPETLQISLPGSTPSGYAIPVALTIQDSATNSTANASVNLTYQKQL